MCVNIVSQIIRCKTGLNRAKQDQRLAVFDDFCFHACLELHVNVNSDLTSTYGKRADATTYTWLLQDTC